MNLKYLFLLLLGVLLLSCDNDDYPYAEIPSVVLNEFWTGYPNARSADFRKNGEVYEVEFEVNDRDKEAVIATSGSIIKEKEEVSWDALPSAVRETLQKNFQKEKVRDPELVRIDEEIFFQVEISRFLINDKVVLTKEGEINPNMNYWK